MKIVVTVDGKPVYTDRTFCIDDAFKVLSIAVEEGVIPPGGVTSVTLTAESNQGLVIDGTCSVVKDEPAPKGPAGDVGEEYEERPAAEVFKEGQACAV